MQEAIHGIVLSCSSTELTCHTVSTNSPAVPTSVCVIQAIQSTAYRVPRTRAKHYRQGNIYDVN